MIESIPYMSIVQIINQLYFHNDSKRVGETSYDKTYNSCNNTTEEKHD